MSFSDFFRGFFGFPGERRPRDPFFGGITREDDEDDEDEEDPRSGPSFGPNPFGFGFGGGVHFHDPFAFNDLFRDFDALFGEMGAMGLPPRPFEFPGIEAPPPPADREKPTLRDSMLKAPDSPRPGRRAGEDGAGPSGPEARLWRPFGGLQEVRPPPAEAPKEDKDLDAWVSSEGLQAIYPPARPKSYFRNVSITKVMGPDGTVEERRTVRDSQGHEETTVSRWNAGDPSPALEGSPEGAPPAPFDSRRRDGLADPFSLLDRFFRGWFSSR